jgi:hypothetical protein
MAFRGLFACTVCSRSLLLALLFYLQALSLSLSAAGSAYYSVAIDFSVAGPSFSDRKKFECMSLNR